MTQSKLPWNENEFVDYLETFYQYLKRLRCLSVLKIL